MADANHKKSEWLKQPMALFDRIVDFFAVLAAIIIIAMVGLLFYEVFMRYVIGRPPPWAWEICETMLCLITFLGATWLLRRNGHVSVDIVYSRLNPRKKMITGTFTALTGAVLCLLLTWAGIEITVDHFKAGITIPGYLDIPKAPFLLVIPIGCFMLSVQFLRQAAEQAQKFLQLKTKG